MTIALTLLICLCGGLGAGLRYLLVSFAGGLMVSWAMAALGARLASDIQAGAR